MIEHEIIPDECKVGIIIPIHKPAKSRDSPDSYRPITLISAIYKFFERVFLTRLQHYVTIENKAFPNAQQNAYQKHLGSLTVSFNLQETVAHNTELQSDTYVASLDSSKAFDHVWHDGLYSKLHDFGISGKALKLIRASYRDLSSYVLVNGVQSQRFEVKQGIRQGGVTSTWYYLLFIDGLLYELQESGTGCTIGSITLGNPTLADDLILIGPSRRSLEKALSIVYEYSRKWRFLFNPAKCHLIIFSPRKLPSNVTVKFGQSEIKQTESITHVVIELHQSFKSSLAIDARIQKGRASLFSVLAIDRDTGFVCPSILASLIEKICFPVVLYGAELWHNMSASDIYKLEKFIRLAAKSVQRFPTRTRTDIALGMLGWLPMTSYVERKQLSFLHSLCSMHPNMLPRKVFDLRMNLFVLKGYKNQLGFVPEIWKVLRKFNLEEYLQNYLANAVFPSKFVWKTIVNRKIREFYEIAWHERLNADDDFARFRTVQTDLSLSNIWTVCHEKSSAHAMLIAARLCATTQQNNDLIQCTLCHSATSDINKHIIIACFMFTPHREGFIRLITNHVNPDIGNRLRQIDLESLFSAILGAKTQTCFASCTGAEYEAFLYNSILFVSQVVTLYRMYNRVFV